MNSDDKGINGNAFCPVHADWEEFINEFGRARKDCKEVKEVMELVVANTKHLAELPALKSIMSEIKENLIAPAISKDQVPTATMNIILDAQSKSLRAANLSLSFVILVLIVVIGFLLVGENFKVIVPLIHAVPIPVPSVSLPILGV